MPPRAADNYSLQSRLLLAFSLLLFVFLGLTGLVLDRAFRDSVEAGAAERMRGQLYLILGEVELESGEFYFLEDLPEPRFGQLDSGLYGFISQRALGELWRSDSARALSLLEPDILIEPITEGESRFFTTYSAQGEELFAFQYGILWENGITEYCFTVLENSTPYYLEIRNFRNDLWSWLGGVAALLLLIQILLLRWGLLPLQRMARDLKQIEAGGKDQLDLGYPRELQGVTANLNLLIESERRQQQRYRTTLADLAHSLKTPLAVIAGAVEKLAKPETGEPGDPDDQDARGEQSAQGQLRTVSEQVGRMNQIVTWQLQRAVRTAGSSSLGKSVNAATALDKVLAALGKVYQDKNMAVESECAADAVFHGDERDLLEILGNVLDNAFKHGGHRLRVAIARTEAGQLQIMVEDDGAGIPDDKKAFVLERGARADTVAEGEGIGLAVVKDIVSSYRGSVSIDRGRLGGARVCLRLFANPVDTQTPGG